MIIIGQSSLVFDFVYIFGRKPANQYVELPIECTEDAAFPLFQKAVEEKPGNVVICTQNESALKKKFELLELYAGTDYYFFSDLRPVFFSVLQKQKIGTEVAEHLWQLYRKIFYAPHGRYLPCHHPFYEAEISFDGNVYTCCSAVMPFAIGNIQQENFKNIWHSEKAKLLRLSLLNGTAIFCSLEKCENLRICTEMKRINNVQVSDDPLILNIAIDASCNLSCPSCRSSIISAGKEEIKKKRKWGAGIAEVLNSNLKHLYVAGNGECMVSKVYQDFLINHVMHYFSGNLHLVTNGQLWNDFLIQTIISRFCPEILISVDAWQKETYERIRRGGSYEKILENIKKYVALKKCGMLSGVVVRFVVQESNYLEIPEFIDGMRQLGIDRMEFTRLVNGGAFVPESFFRSSLLDEEGSLKEKYHSFFEKNIWPRLGQDIYMDASYLPKKML